MSAFHQFRTFPIAAHAICPSSPSQSPTGHRSVPWSRCLAVTRAVQSHMEESQADRSAWGAFSLGPMQPRRLHPGRTEAP